MTICEKLRQIPETQWLEERRRRCGINDRSLTKFKGIGRLGIGSLLNDRRTIAECTIGSYLVVQDSFHFSSKYRISLKERFEMLTESQE
jgi:hypothetical protein